MLLLIWVTVLIASLVLYLRDLQARLVRRQLSQLPVVPLLGHMSGVVLRKEHVTAALRRSYQAFPQDKIVGHYEFLNPMLLVRDPELLKCIAVKDFEYFVDRRAFGDPDDPVFGRNLLLLKGDEWKAMRSTLSPAFTSSKIKLMVPFMVDVAVKMNEELTRKIEDTQEGYIDIDVKELTSRFANDVIATCAFGLRVNSMSMDNEFYKKARDVTSFTFSRFMKVIGFRSLPNLMKFLKVSLLPASLAEFFSTVVLGSMSQRERHSIVRNDMIHLLMEAKKGRLVYDNNVTETAAGYASVVDSAVTKKHAVTDWSDSDLVSQAVLFLIAGFVTVSTELSFLLHELAANPEVQDKLVEEIRENEAQNEGQFKFESIQKMTYLDMVVCETLRMWPAAAMIDRVCVKDYNAGRPNKHATEDFVVKKDEVLTIPVWSFHRDPQYFPNPEKFDPERFSVENRHKIKPFTYMPFGVGPRNCIGSRFALCEVKVMVYQLLKTLEVSLCSKSCVPGRLAAGSLDMKMSGGFWLRIKMRQR
ncbi:cytochrome P450 9e2-like [Ostrinia nubilalis]|uniref:cytochrome P450 9e2-like n=1 Tax=Ostrinia nubilalis TaxID=29057 RepID=UPI0030824951